MLKLVVHDVTVYHREMDLHGDQGIEECWIHTLAIANGCYSFHLVYRY